MKKSIIFLIISIVSIGIHAQDNTKATYTSILAKNGFAPIKSELLIKGSQSIFKSVHRETPEKVIVDEETGEVTLNRPVPDSIQPVVITNFNTSKIRSKMYITENDGNTYEEVYIEESIKMNWVFVDETKKIDAYLCKKATTHFRGRDYTAWYTEDIPVSIGPWKFHGLPGLIIEISDSTSEVSFTIEKFEYPYKNPIKITSYQGDTMTPEQYIDVRNEARKKSDKFFTAKLLSKLPRGASIELTKDGNNEIEKNI